MGPMDTVLSAFQALTFQEWVLGTAVVMMGRREVMRQERLLVKMKERGERYKYDRLGSVSFLIWGHALTFIGLGLLWDPMARVAWVVGGFSRWMLIPGPCGTALFNRYPYRLVRNGFLIAFGYGCIRYGLQPILH